MNLILKGRYELQEGSAVYHDENIICKRTGSVVKHDPKKQTVTIEADVCGLDKLYFCVDNKAVTVSDQFRDFKKNKIDERLIKSLQTKGYIPYPLTIRRNVFKAPPGLQVIIEFNKIETKISYAPSKILKIFDRKSFKTSRLKENILKALKVQVSDKQKIVSSYSGGFDSMLLTNTFTNQLAGLVHFVDKQKIPDTPIQTKSVIVGNDEPFTKQDVERYFYSVDEPNCDQAGFAEYLLAKRVQSEFRIAIKQELLLMNGQAMDALFGNGRIYYQAWLSKTLTQPLERARKIYLDSNKNGIVIRSAGYLVNYMTRFIKFYIPPNIMKAHPECIKIIHIYNTAINNDDVNKMGALMYLLYYPLHGVEKVKIAQRANQIKYFLPFMSPEFCSLAFSIKGSKKKGLLRGKRILYKIFPEVRGYVSGGFAPKGLNRKLIKNSRSYEQFFADEWLKRQGCK